MVLSHYTHKAFPDKLVKDVLILTIIRLSHFY